MLEEQARSQPATFESAARDPWSWRPLLLAGLGLATGLAVHAIVGDKGPLPLSALQSSAAAFLTVFAGLTVFTLERRRWQWALGFAVAGAAVSALLLYGSGNTDSWSATEAWRTVSLFVAILTAAPLFQTARDEGALRFPYPRVHDHVWTNVVLWCAGWAFVAITFLMTVLLANLFALIGIRFLQRLMGELWFVFALGGASYGAAVGLFREREPVVRIAQRVLAAVLSVLAPVLGAGLLLFLLALPFTGLNALWDATKATTPILLACVIGSLALVNIVIAGEPRDEARNPASRLGAMALGLAVLPLAILAAIATGLRIGQYGFTPERLWGLVFVMLATICGVAYFADLVRGRLAWAERIRPSNLVLLFLVCGTALLLATPLLSFNAISTRDQVARLESGRIKPDKFDWAALAFDFGEPGKVALRKLASDRNEVVASRARQVAGMKDRWEVASFDEKVDREMKMSRQVRLIPADAPLPVALRDAVADNVSCSNDNRCTLLMLPVSNEAMLFRDLCFKPAEQPGRGSGRGTGWTVISDSLDCVAYDRYLLRGDKWAKVGDEKPATDASAKLQRDAGYKAGRIEVRTVQARQVFVGGVPVGDPFE